MKTIFRKHHLKNATIFDLMSDNKEVKQTVALGYLMANDSQFLQSFINLPTIKMRIESFDYSSNLKNYDEVIINTEKHSTENKRADILVEFYQNNTACFAIIIEAKSISTAVSSSKIEQQLNDYLTVQDFQLRTQNKIGCTLTKYDLILENPHHCTIAWREIIFLLQKSRSQLAKDYFNFLINIEGNMKLADLPHNRNTA